MEIIFQPCVNEFSKHECTYKIHYKVDNNRLLPSFNISTMGPPYSINMFYQKRKKID